MTSDNFDFLNSMPDPLEVNLEDAFDIHFRYNNDAESSVKKSLNDILTWAKTRLQLSPITLEFLADIENTRTVDAILYFASEDDLVKFQRNPVIQCYVQRKLQGTPETNASASRSRTKGRRNA